MSSDYQLKLALAHEIELALKWQKTYETLTVEFSGLLKEFFRYCESHGIQPQTDYELCRLMQRINVVISDTIEKKEEEKT